MPRLVVSLTSFCSVAASSAAGSVSSDTSRSTAGDIFTLFATLSLLSFNRLVGMGAVLCCSMWSTSAQGRNHWAPGNTLRINGNNPGFERDG
jgi:hypothetical protein